MVVGVLLHILLLQFLFIEDNISLEQKFIMERFLRKQVLFRLIFISQYTSLFSQDQRGEQFRKISSVWTVNSQSSPNQDPTLLPLAISTPPPTHSSTLSPTTTLPPSQSTQSMHSINNQDEDHCDSKSFQFFNLSHNVLRYFCDISSLEDIKKLTTAKTDACCRVVKFILQSSCFDQCVDNVNVFDSTVLLVDLWHVICRFEKQLCQQPQENKSAAKLAENKILQSYSENENSTDEIADLGGRIKIPVPSPTSFAHSPKSTSQLTIAQVLASVPVFSIIYKQFVNTQMVRMLNDTSFVATYLIPTDAAFAYLSNLTGIDIQNFEKISDWKQVLLYHMFSGVHKMQLMPDSYNNLNLLKSMQGNWTSVYSRERLLGCCVPGNGANIIVKDVQVLNGVFHVIDNVLLPFKISL
eukprot:TRINITY_DN22838_c1_g3_i3.p1 TRINITY_DN22838_c1_g3~~TRINITY_DN22838_c1_g3_i3.p1  ORF type:complete len:431 (-),score=19.73 TRINITY_DN22838_c1_g3_i3:524-1756(-)